MKVKVGNTTYDGVLEPVMAILNQSDKRNIANMHESLTKYFQGPNSMSDQEIDEFMEVPSH